MTPILSCLPSNLGNNTYENNKQTKNKTTQKPSGVSGQELLTLPTGCHTFTEEWGTHFRKTF